MSNPICHLPSLEELKERVKDEKWIKQYKKASSFIGPSESISYILKFLNTTSYDEKIGFHPREGCDN